MSRHLCVPFVAALLIPVASVHAADDPKAIVTKAIEAHGGTEALTKLKAGRSSLKGKLTLPGVGEVDFTQEAAYMMPDKVREALELTVEFADQCRDIERRRFWSATAFLSLSTASGCFANAQTIR